MTTTAAPRQSPARTRTRYWAIELIPQCILGAATLVFALTKWNAVRSALESMQAVAINTAVAVGWLLFSLVLMPWLVRRQSVRVAIVSLAAVMLAWVLFANAYRDTTVIETLRGLDPPAAAPALDAAAPDPPTTVPTAPTAAAAAAIPVRIRSAPLHGINHRASGTASIIRQPDGRLVVGLEDIDIEPGPDYRVYVVPGDTESTAAGAVELDALRGNQGTQFYDVPRDVTVDEGEWTVLVWCKRFAVPVAAAVPA